MEKREQGFTLYKKGMKYAEIAARLDVPLSTVKSWAARYWKAEDASKGCKKVATKTQKVATKNASKPPGKAVDKGGAPKGNVNAVGHEGVLPKGTQNALKHGGYSKLLFATFSEDKLQALDEEGEVDEEKALVDEIHLLTLRESYLLERIDLYSKPQTDKNGNPKPPLSMTGMVTSSDKRDFNRLDQSKAKSEADKVAYQRAIDRKVESGDRLPGNVNHVTTTTEANHLIVERLERLLTDVQKQKAKCIAQLAEVRRNKAEESNSFVDEWAALVAEREGGSED